MRKDIILSLLAIILIAILVFSGSLIVIYNQGLKVIGTYSSGVSITTEGHEEIKNINILILGIDDVEGVSRSDTNVLVNINSARKNVQILSIPRDTRIYIPGYGLDKVGHAYAFDGVPLAATSISNLLQIPIHYYVKVDFSSFESLIDSIGGLEIEVDKHMQYEDQAADLHIDISAGLQKLDGETALKYVRYRDSTGDIGRISRQQRLMKAALEKVLQPSMITRLPGLARQLWNSINTNLTFTEMLGLIGYSNEIDHENVISVNLPGVPEYIDGISYWLPVEYELDNVVDKVFKSSGYPEISDLRIRVLNGCGIAGIAGRTRAYLEGLGYNVVEIGNASHYGYERTLIIDKIGYPQGAKEIASLFNDNVVSGLHYSIDDSDITIIVGADFNI